MKKITLLLLGIVFALSACNKTDQKKAGISESDAKDVEKILGENGGEGCFIPYQAKVCELIDKETIAQILGVDAGKMTVMDVFKTLHESGKNKDKPYKGSQSAICDYEWEDETKKIKEYIPGLGKEVDLPMYAKVQITGLALQKNVASFKQTHRSVSKDEMEEAGKNASERIDKSGKHTKQEVNTATDMLNALSEAQVVTYLNDLGEAAASTRSKLSGEQAELAVYYRGNQFRVYVNMGGKTHAQNLELSVQIAKEVLKKCK